MKSLTRFLSDEDGVSAIEYGLIAAFIAVGIGMALTSLGATLFTSYAKVASGLSPTIWIPNPF
jgi:pilus assembly protein Flp/PilA